MYRDIIARSFRVRLFAGIVLFLVALILINTAFFYHYIDTDIGDVYARKVSMASQFKTEIIKQTLTVYCLFAFICMVGIVAATIIGTHRIVGPLVGVKRVAAHLAKGNLDVSLRLRKNDAVQPLADALNDLASSYRERYSKVSETIDDLYRDVCELSEFIQNGDSKAAEDKRLAMAEKTEEVNRLLREIKI